MSLLLVTCSFKAGQTDFDLLQSSSAILSGTDYGPNADAGKNIASDTTGSYSLIQILKQENDRIINELKCERMIAGLFAMIYLLKIKETVINGRTIQIAFDQCNPGFKKNYPCVYSFIGQLKIRKLTNGVILINTINQQPMSLDKMRVYDCSQIKIRDLSGGNIRIDILRGVEVGMAFWWYDLNFVELFKSGGDILFNYKKNTQLVLNLRKDIMK
jgi:hypothetical protein